MFSLKVCSHAARMVFAMLVCSQTMAGVVITGTRLIYPASQKEITVKLNNVGVSPALVQAWVDDGDVKSSPTNSKAPFVLSPPVSRVDPGKGQSLRLMFTGNTLPGGKESVFWLNVLEIPPKTEGPVDANVLQLAFRSRIKIFYRPDGLVGSPAEAPALLQWRVISQGAGFALQAFNPTAFHVSLVELGISVGGQRHEARGGMVNPGQTQVFALPGLRSKPSGLAQVGFNAVNDYGALIPVTRPLEP